jgi:hypothetical protein
MKPILKKLIGHSMSAALPSSSRDARPSLQLIHLMNVLVRPAIAYPTLGPRPSRSTHVDFRSIVAMPR